MKVIFELPSKATSDRNLSSFQWLNNPNSLLFIIENGKRIRTISVDSKPPKQIHFENLNEKRLCTSFSWNHDATLLTLVLDERHLYHWHLASNQLKHFKTFNKDVSNGGSKQKGVNTVSLIAWSKISNRLVVCFTSGKMVIYNLSDFNNSTEKFINNSNGVLRQVLQLEVCEHLDMFACFTILSEVMVMTFDGEAKFYIQEDLPNMCKIRFSFPSRNPKSSSSLKFNDAIRLATTSHRRESGVHDLGQLASDLLAKQNSKLATSTIWLSYQFREGSLKFKRIASGYDSLETSSKEDLRLDIYGPNENYGSSHRTILVDHFWISQNRLICCDSTGTIKMLELRQSSQTVQFMANVYSPIISELVNIRSECMASPVQQMMINSPSQDSADLIDPASFHPMENYDFRFRPKKSADHSMGARGSTSGLDKPEKVRGQGGGSKNSNDDCLSIVAMSAYEIYYYELILNPNQLGSVVSLERVDDIDLSVNLRSLNLTLEGASWSYDCSMLAIRHSAGYMVVRTILDNYIIATCGPKTAQLSAPNEITVLDFQIRQDVGQHAQSPSSFRVSSPGATGSQVSDSNELPNEPAQDRVMSKPSQRVTLVINVIMKPSVMAIGPAHLAIALNNRIHLYKVVEDDDYLIGNRNHRQLAAEVAEPTQLEFPSIVSEMQLSSNFLAILFQDGRLKLMSIPRSNTNRVQSSPEPLPVSEVTEVIPNQDDSIRERTFPNPGQRFDPISGFVLTESLFLYSTGSQNLYVFCLLQWSIIQMLDCSTNKQLSSPIVSFHSNEQSNKFVCLTKPAHEMNQDHHHHLPGHINHHQSSCNCYLYDLRTNTLVSFELAQGKLFDRIIEAQLDSLLATELVFVRNEWRQRMCEWLADRKSSHIRLNQIRDVIWDTDGRTVLLIEPKMMYNMALLEHTMEWEPSRSLVQFVASLPKAINHQAVYISHGVISYQTKLGRMINGILLPHDDDLRLMTLEQLIEELRESRLSDNRLINENYDQQQQVVNSQQLAERGQEHWQLYRIEVARLKLEYLMSILPIYSLARCKSILEHIAIEKQFSLIDNDDDDDREPGNSLSQLSLGDRLAFRVLAAWSIYTWNFNFALTVYRRARMTSHSRLIASLRDSNSPANSSSANLRRRILLGVLELPQDSI